ncbi:NtaA/DmoA family FMN-dependent monooxygenase [Rhizobium calliandrae]|uniref:NtaA/DmoA family FMN-dependent monooxygenase n=1 Tax=Rhizobium calliandrae TaxID=1312182 RepID=A0ABT7KIN6_9HYPH|nr:NtaA/DmoA family FMN-dependent monooxygenase [Rhizobium calliandrae]MDL2408496.1 NtaA/DmoA family FMN-dependent monooxygenase [Rhizobium calliandrae]
MQRRLILTAGINSTGYLADSWRHVSDSPLVFAEFDHYLRATRIAHAGRLDAVFFSDHPALGADPAQRPLHSFEPLTLSTALAVAVPDIGFEITVSSTYSAPYDLARRLATLDHISGGRVICNIVSSFNPAVAANYGSAPLPPREARYRQAHEFMSVVTALLKSWNLRRPVDPQSGVWDPDFARPISHKGEFYSVAGPLNVPSDARRRALIGQAGASGPGLDFAAAYGEIIYCSLLSLPAAWNFRDELHARAKARGRAPASLRIVPGLVPIIGRTRAEALERHDAVSGAGSEKGLLRRFARDAGIDYATLDPDAPVANDLFKTSADQQRPAGFTQALAELARHERITPRQFVRRVEGGHRLVAGTADDVASDIIAWWRSGVVEGFNIQTPVLPEDLSDFVEQVVPRLQKAGIFPREYESGSLRERFELTGEI